MVALEDSECAEPFSSGGQICVSGADWVWVYAVECTWEQGVRLERLGIMQSSSLGSMEWSSPRSLGVSALGS